MGRAEDAEMLCHELDLLHDRIARHEADLQRQCQLSRGLMREVRRLRLNNAQLTTGRGFRAP